MDVRRIGSGEREAVTPEIPGFVRETAFAGDDHWVGYASTEPDFDTGWHHHGEYDSYVYVVSGRARIDFGPGGGESVEGGPGDFICVPKGKVHREVNVGDEPNALAVVRVGSGPPVVPADGPEAPGGPGG